MYVARPVTSYRLLALGAGPGAVGLVAASFALVPLFVAIPLGRFADRRGGPLLAVGGSLQALACLLLAVGKTALALGVASAVLGLGHLALALGVQEVIARESDSERHDEHFGLLTAGVSLGQLIGPVLGGALLGANADLSSTTIALLVAACVAAGATWSALLADRTRPALDAARVGSRQGSVRAILSTPGVAAGIFASVAVLSAADVFTAYMPVLGEERGIAPSVIGVILGVRAAASIASRVGIRRLVEVVGRSRLIAVSALAAAAAFAALTTVSNVWIMGLLAVVVGFGLGFGQPLSMTIVVQLVPAHARATALAVRLTGNRLGQVAAPAAAGLLAGNGGTKPVFLLLTGSLGLSAAVMRRASRPPHTSVERPTAARGER